jgi:septal ring factor EnvC (AmiA/AmiB activator)
MDRKSIRHLDRARRLIQLGRDSVDLRRRWEATEQQLCEQTAEAAKLHEYHTAEVAHLQTLVNARKQDLAALQWRHDIMTSTLARVTAELARAESNVAALETRLAEKDNDIARLVSEEIEPRLLRARLARRRTELDDALNTISQFRRLLLSVRDNQPLVWKRVAAACPQDVGALDGAEPAIAPTMEAR